MSIDTEIAKRNLNVFRRVSIKRRNNSDGLYETDWLDITEYIKRYGTIQRSIDYQRLNRFTHSGLNLTVRNDTGAFNSETDVNSLWYGYLTRYRTLVKVEAGYLTEDMEELPTNSTLGIFIMQDEIPLNAVNNEAVINANSLVNVFNEVQAQDVAGLGPTQSASDYFTKIKNHTDGSSNFIFQQFISSAAWNIQTTTIQYNLATSTSIGSMTCWDFMEKLAEAEGYVLFIDRTGSLRYQDRDVNTSATQFTFYGYGQEKMNIIEISQYKEAYNKLYNFIRMKYLEADTSTSYVTAGTTTTVDPASDTWKYGSRIYPFTNTFTGNTAAAQSVVDGLLTQFNDLKNECAFKAKFIPHLDISDNIALSHRSFTIENTTVWGTAYFDIDTFPTELGENINWSNKGFLNIAIKHDLDKFTSTFNVREQ